MKALNLAQMGARIKTLRGEISQADFAGKFGISQVDVSRLENGSFKNPSIELLLEVAEVTKCDLVWLITGVEPVRIELADDERKLIKAYRRAPGKDIKAVRALLEIED